MIRVNWKIGQRDRRQDQVFQTIDGQKARGPGADRNHLATAETRQPLQDHGKQQDQQDADQERRQRHAEQRAHHHQLRHQAATAQCRIDTHRDAEQQGDDGRGDRQLQRGRQALDDQRRDFAALTQAEAEFALHGIADKTSKLDRERPVEPEIGAQLGALIRRRILTEQIGDRIAHILEQHECDERHRQHHDDRLHEATQNEGEHEPSTARPQRLSRLQHAYRGRFNGGHIQA